MPSLSKRILVWLGGLAVGLAALGVFLPLLPTTPFLLLAGACFARSSERHYEWLMNHRVFGPYLRQYREHGTIPMRAKVATLALLWLTLSASMFFLTDSSVVRVVLPIVGLGVTAFVLSIKS